MKNLTIIVQTYNRETKLKRNLHSLAKQSDKNFKILIYANGASYNVVKIAKEILRNEVEYKVVSSQNNVGLVRARNNSVKHVSTKFFARIDDDDWAATDFVEQANSKIEQGHDVIFVTTVNDKFKVENRDKFIYGWEPWRYIIKKEDFVNYPEIMPEDYSSSVFYLQQSKNPSFQDVKIYVDDPSINRHHPMFADYDDFTEVWKKRIKNNDVFKDYDAWFIGRGYQRRMIKKNFSNFWVLNKLIYLRGKYEDSQKSERKEVLKDYKQAKKQMKGLKVPISSMIIWSKIYILFSRKK